MNFSDREHFPPRRKTRPVKVGRLVIGGDAPIVVQSMTKTDTRDGEKTVEQARQMEAAGCEGVRMAVPDIEAAKALAEIRDRKSVGEGKSVDLGGRRIIKKKKKT